MSRDHLLRALLPEQDLRILVCEATSVAQHAASLQDCVGTAADIFGQSIVGALLAAGLGKDQQRVTVQLAGSGPMRGLFTDASSDGSVRGYVREPKVDFPGRAPDLTTAVGPEGYLSVLRELPNGEFYRAAVALDHARLDRNLEHYYATSEQVQTTISIEVQMGPDGRPTRAVGVLVQRLPGGDGDVLERIRERIHAGVLRDALDGESGGARAALPLVEGLGTLEVLEDVPVGFRCACSRERALRGVASAGVDEILDMVARDRGAEVNCEFCRTTYRFEAAELLQLIDDLEPRGD